MRSLSKDRAARAGAMTEQTDDAQAGAISDDVTERLPAHVERAMDRASEDDRLWFAAHPKRRWRLRNAIAFECIGENTTSLEGWSERVIVIQHAPGYRQRVPCVAADDCPNSGETGEPPEAVIRQMFRRHAPREVKWEVNDFRRFVRRAVKIEASS